MLCIDSLIIDANHHGLFCPRIVKQVSEKIKLFSVLLGKKLTYIG